MSRAAKVKRLIERYGQRVEAVTEDGVSSGSYRAFIQPVRYKNKMYLNDVESPIGTVSENYYLYIGPADVQLKENEGRVIIRSDSMRCTAERAESVYLGTEPIYVWAILRRVVEEDE